MGGDKEIERERQRRRGRGREREKMKKERTKETVIMVFFMIVYNSWTKL